MQQKRLVKDDLLTNNCVQLGDKAPHFSAITTNGLISFPEDFKGKWVILFSHPSDFTAVCTTEFLYLAKMTAEFEALNTALIGLSVDSLSSHLAWLLTIQEEVSFAGIKSQKITFPLIADTSTEVARMYGMIHDNVATDKTIRGLVFIDPRGIIRCSQFYPQNIGRNFDEIKRVLIALQVSDAINVSLPANWMPGDDVVTQQPQNINDVEKSCAVGAQSSGAWFLSLLPLPLSELEKILNMRGKNLN